MDNMTLTSKEEVRKTIIELISIVNAVDERDDAIVARARLLLQNLQQCIKLIQGGQHETKST